MTLRQLRSILVFKVIAASLVLSGCMATERNVSSDVKIANPWAAVALFDPKGAVTPGAKATGERSLKQLNVLALSGGGADGAFGAGVLSGWTELGTRPKFDIVTGVSTGALQSTFAFLGPQYDASLKDLYTATTSHDIFTHRGVAGLLGDSLMDTEALETKLEQVITDDVLAQVAAEHRAGRRLYVATTNLDAGVVAVWDMGKIAASDQPWRGELYRDILRASAAVPAFFQPVMIHPHADGDDDQGQMHVDGGVKAPVLLRSFMVERPARSKNVYMLINGAMRLRADSPVSSGMMSIAKKSIAELLRGLTYKTVYQAYVVTRHSNAAFNLGFVPDNVMETKDPLEFDPAEMRMLFDAGREAVRTPGFWKPEPASAFAAPRLRFAAAFAERENHFVVVGCVLIDVGRRQRFGDQRVDRIAGGAYCAADAIDLRSQQLFACDLAQADAQRRGIGSRTARRTEHSPRFDADAHEQLSVGHRAVARHVADRDLIAHAGRICAADTDRGLARLDLDDRAVDMLGPGRTVRIRRRAGRIERQEVAELRRHRIAAGDGARRAAAACDRQGARRSQHARGAPRITLYAHTGLSHERSCIAIFGPACQRVAEVAQGRASNPWPKPVRLMGMPMPSSGV